MKQRAVEKVWFGYDIQVAPGPVLRPTAIRFWSKENFANHTPDKPFFYKSDALVGLSLVHLNSQIQNPFTTPHMSYPFCHEAWQALEPHFELYHRSAGRVQAIRSQLELTPASQLEKFEESLHKTIQSAQKDSVLDLDVLCEVLEHIEILEKTLQSDLLYNFKIKFSKETTRTLHHLFSLLFNLRSLIAVDHNAHVLDSSYETLKVDSITDYVPRPEYISNDAILYYGLLKQKKDIPVPVYQQMLKHFYQYAHNGVCLIESLPPHFINSWKASELSEALHIVQMDWLLGTDAGLLYRIREELCGLREGYEMIFWPDWVERKSEPRGTLTLSCELCRDDMYKHKSAA